MKKIITLSGFCFFALQCFSQWSSNWQEQYQHATVQNFSSESRKVISDSNGNVFALSDVTSDVDSFNHPTAQTHYYVVLRKYDYLGTLLVHRQIEVFNMQLSGYDYRSAFALETDASGYIYIGYSTYSAGNYDIAVAKYTNAMTLVWKSVCTLGGDQSGVGMVVSGGNVYVAYKSVAGGITTYPIIKFESTGFPQQPPLFTFDANLDVVNAITMPAGSKYLYVTGSRLVSGAKAVMTAAVNTNGTGTKWKYMFNNNSVTGDDVGNNLVVGSDGNIYIVGTAYSSAASGNDGLVLSYSGSTGVFRGSLILNYNTTTDLGSLIANGQSGYIYTAGTTNTQLIINKISLNPFRSVNTAVYAPTPVSSYTAVTLVSAFDIKVAPVTYNVYTTGSVNANAAAGNFTASFLTKTGQNGFVFAPLIIQPVEGSFTDNYKGSAIALDPTHGNNILWLRSQWSTNSNHFLEHVVLNGLDASTLRTVNLFGANELKTSQTLSPADFTFYPIPAKGYINIDAPTTIYNIELFDIIGNKAATIMPAGNKFDVSKLNAGVYFAKINSQAGVVTKRIVIE